MTEARWVVPTNFRSRFFGRVGLVVDVSADQKTLRVKYGADGPSEWTRNFREATPAEVAQVMGARK